jgi:hypothetical protein
MIKNKNIYDTHGASFDGEQLIFYCYNENLTNIEELSLIQYRAYERAIQRQYRLFFKCYTGQSTHVIPAVGLN